MILYLSLERINSGETPYQVEPTEQNGFYQFFTDGGVHYSVGFMEDDVLLSKNSYQLIIANINNHKSPRNRKVRDTIVSIVDEFFRCNNSTLLYIVRPVIINNVCVAACLNIGFPLIIEKHFLQ